MRNTIDLVKKLLAPQQKQRLMWQADAGPRSLSHMQCFITSAVYLALGNAHCLRNATMWCQLPTRFPPGKHFETTNHTDTLHLRNDLFVRRTEHCTQWWLV